MAENDEHPLRTPRYSLSELEAYDAMLAFLVAYWERGGKSDNSLAGLLGGLSRDTWVGGSTADPAQWNDWLAAVEKVKSSSRSR